MSKRCEWDGCTECATFRDLGGGQVRKHGNNLWDGFLRWGKYFTTEGPEVLRWDVVRLVFKRQGSVL